MEIGDQGIDGFEGVAGIDKDLGFADCGMNLAVGGGNGLKYTAARCAHGNDPAALGTAAVDLFCHLF